MIDLLQRIEIADLFYYTLLQLPSDVKNSKCFYLRFSCLLKVDVKLPISKLFSIYVTYDGFTSTVVSVPAFHQTLFATTRHYGIYIT